MQQHLAGEEIAYTGRELRSHWLLDRFDLRGNAIAAFIGPCDVPLEAMVDLADVRAGAAIRARLMLHFIAEFFDCDLATAILRQRLLVALAGELLISGCHSERSEEPRPTLGAETLRLADPCGSAAQGDRGDAGPARCAIRRTGDDLYLGERKLSVSIATVSPVSTLIHLGINIDPEGAPVAAVGLAELQVEPRAFARSLMESFARELASAEEARCKVRSVP